MTLSDKSVQEFKDIYKKEYGVELSNDKARDYSERLTAFAKILIDQTIIEQRRKKRLEKEPKGFCLDENEGIYNCRVCYQSISGKNAWWDLNGVKCLDCQRNIREGVIPAEICTNDDIWMREWQIQSDFGLHSATVRKICREGLLKGIDLKRKDGATYFTLYLVKDNQEFFKKYPKKPKMKMTYLAHSSSVQA